MMRWFAAGLVIALCAGAPAAEPNGLVVLLTDYGADSVYVGMLKGAVYSTNVELKTDSITNSVPAFDIAAGAWMLAEACGAFPEGTVFCCVVDPGVGTERKCVVLETGNGQWFVAPDNGLLTAVAERDGVRALRECTNKALFFAKGASTTFHGRDIFGPVAAALASGTPPAEVGPELASMTRLELPGSRVDNGTAFGEVIRRDPYGNLVTSIRREDLAALGLRYGDGVDVTIGDANYTAPFVRTYGSVPPGDRLVLVQSSGFVECAVNMNSLADIIAEGLHAEVRLSKHE